MEAPEYFPLWSETWDGQKLEEARSLIEDMLIEWSEAWRLKRAGEELDLRYVATTVQTLQEWLNRLPPLLHLMAESNG